MYTVCIILYRFFTVGSHVIFISHRDNLNSQVQLRQTRPSCSVQSDCFPVEFSNNTVVPRAFVQCLSNGNCFCSECFLLNANINRCYFESPQCYFFNPNTSMCVDRRRSQVVAFALSLTLSGLGVANFYIGQNGLAGGQLFLFIFVFVGICLVTCVPCCTFCGISDDGLVRHISVATVIQSVCLVHSSSLSSQGAVCTVFAVLCTIIVAILLICASLATWAWWIADAVIFGTNQRVAGDGCPLIPNL